MRKLFIFLILFITYSCSQALVHKTDQNEDLVSVQVALDLARSSYLKGCVDTFHILKIPKPFQECLEKAKAHEREIIDIINQEPIVPSSH